MNDGSTNQLDGAMARTPSIGAASERSFKRLRYRLRRENYGDQAASLPSAVDPQPRGHEDQTPIIEKLKSDLAQMQDQYLRARSDLENFRKRVAREREEQRKYANESIIKGLLETVDNLERAIQGAELAQDIKSLHQGVEMIHRQFLTALERQGVTVVDANPGSKFNPACHEAVMVESRPGFEDDTIIECLQNGYIMNDRVMRAAMVKVAKKG